jgi:hypothetical protein
MNPTNNILDDPLHASAASRPTDLFSDIADFFSFIWEELRPFPGRGLATARLVVAAVATTIICQTLRIPFPSIAAFLVFMVVTDTGASFLRIGLVGALESDLCRCKASRREKMFRIFPGLDFWNIPPILRQQRTKVAGVSSQSAGYDLVR